jgi:hypothetical protein
MNIHPSSPRQNGVIIAALFQDWQLVSGLAMIGENFRRW